MNPDSPERPKHAPSSGEERTRRALSGAGVAAAAGIALGAVAGPWVAARQGSPGAGAAVLLAGVFGGLGVAAWIIWRTATWKP